MGKRCIIPGRSCGWLGLHLCGLVRRGWVSLARPCRFVGRLAAIGSVRHAALLPRTSGLSVACIPLPLNLESQVLGV